MKPILAPSISIRACEVSDISQITEIYADAVAHGTASFETEPPNREEMLLRRSNLVANNFPYLVAECAGDIIGYAYAGTYRARFAYGATVENSVYIRPDRKGQGIGTALLKALILEATERDYRQMVAVIGDSKNVASIALHKSVGFEMVGYRFDANPTW